jgi:hypothetical protein
MNDMGKQYEYVERFKYAAYHEAGHAVAAVLLGLPFDYVVIEPKGRAVPVDGSDEKSSGAVVRTLWSIDRRAEILMLLSGPMAQSIYTKRGLAGTMLEGGVSDYDKARKVAAGDDLTPFEKEARQLMHTNWRAVTCVASTLAAVGALDHDTVCALTKCALELPTS